MRRFRVSYIRGLFILASIAVTAVITFRLPSQPTHQVAQAGVPARSSSKQVASTLGLVTPAGASNYGPDHSLFVFGNNNRQISEYRLVALYGTPSEPVLGALGHYNLMQAIVAAKRMAATYRPLSQQPVMPAFEIITTIASASATDNNDYSQEIDARSLQPWISMARLAGVYVVLDLQPGRSDFLSQAKEYQMLLDQPNVGLALDPEWRLGPAQLPLAQIGSVSIDEVNTVGNWLANEVKTNRLPQKLLLLHQFQLSMLPGRQQLNTTHPELAYTIQMDGQGSPSMKYDTWRAIIQQPPANARFGWKNFYIKDNPMLTPQQTMQISPEPAYISYQ